VTASRLWVFGAGLWLAVWAAAALGAPGLAPHDPHASVGEPWSPPGPGHPLGTNDVGQDLLSELVHGARTSLLVGGAAALGATGLAVGAGLASAVWGGLWDRLLMRLVDLCLVVPALALALVVAAFVGSGVFPTVLLLAALLWARGARVIRAQALAMLQRGWVIALRAAGARSLYLIRAHLVQALWPLVAAEFVQAMAAALTLEASLSFLGLGDPTVKSWGGMLYYAQARGAVVTGAWLWWAVPPGLCVGLTVASLAMLGFALEERVHPALRAARAGPAIWPQIPADPLRIARGVLEVEALTVEYGTGPAAVRALDGVSGHVRPGELVGVVGPSGSGKSTLVTAAMGLLRSPARVLGGSVCVVGVCWGSVDAKRARQLRGRSIALLPQTALHAWDPLRPVVDQVAEAVATHQALSRREARLRAQAVLKEVGFPKSRMGAYPHALSGGERQRAWLAMALVNGPDLLLLDEPTTGLDVLGQDELVRLVRDRTRVRSRAVVVVSHDLPTVLRLADRIVVLCDGRVVEYGPPDGILRSPEHAYTRRVVGALQALRGSWAAEVVG